MVAMVTIELVIVAMVTIELVMVDMVTIEIYSVTVAILIKNTLINIAMTQHRYTP